jgi:hypothetical protein
MWFWPGSIKSTAAAVVFLAFMNLHTGILFESLINGIPAP